jgi:hypothetical protein
MIRRCQKFPDDPNTLPAFDIDLGSRVLRVFGKRWAWPYGWRNWGCYGWGAGPIGFQLMRPGVEDE